MKIKTSVSKGIGIDPALAIYAFSQKPCASMQLSGERDIL
jgi:hypothetical protein